MKSLDRFKKLINRQRLNPKIFDYSYLLLRNNLFVFKKFKALLIKENKTEILDVGCGFKAWLNFFNKEKFKYVGVDIDRKYSSADFISSADKIPFPNSSFDALIYSEVLEHVENLLKVFKEMHRVAKNETLVFISSPFIFPEHGIPYDFQRLTKYFYRNIFKNDKVILLKESNSSLSTAIVLINLFIESTQLRKFIGLKHIIYTIINLLGISVEAFIKIFLKILNKKFKDQFCAMPLGYALIVRIKK